jgi:cytochrome c biogenesis protein CcdA
MAKYAQLSGRQADDVFQQLASAFPDKKVTKLNKSTIMVSSGKVMAVARVKKDKIKINGDLNTKDPLNIAMIALGIILGLVGVFLIFGILYIIFAKKIKLIRDEVSTVLQ